MVKLDATIFLSLLSAAAALLNSTQLPKEIQCLQKCASRIQIQSLTQDEVCRSWEKGKTCSAECKLDIGTLLLLAPLSVKQMIRKCDNGPASGQPPIFQDAFCVKNCIEFFIYPKIEEKNVTAAQICNSMMETQRCLTSCKAGDAVVEFLRQVAPNALSLLEDACSGDPDEKPMDAETEELMKLEFQAVAKTEACTENCYEEYLNQTIQDVQSACKAWLKFKECMHQCPNGKAVAELIRSIFANAMDTIRGVCESPNALLSESIGTRPAPARPSLFEDTHCVASCLEFPIYPVADENNMTVAQICNSTMETKRCLTSCKAGDAVLVFLRQVVPNALSLLKDACSGHPYQKPMDAKTEELLKVEFQALAKTEACTGNCYEEHLNQTIRDVQSACKAWLKFKECMNQCPNGKPVVELILSIFTKATIMIQGVCENPNILLPEPVVTSPAPAQPPPFKDAFCAKKCLEFFIYAKIEEKNVTVAQICNSMMETKRCLTSCKAGDAVLEFLRQVAPNSLSLLEGVCSGDPDEKPIDAETEGLLKPDFQVLAKTRTCTKGCYEEYLNQTIQDVQSICKAWLKFKKCMYQCPNGKAVVELIRSIFTKDMDTIQGVCEGPNALLPESIVTSPAPAQPPPFKDAFCAKKCLEFFIYPKIEEKNVTVAQICNSMMETTRCLTSCKAGDAVLEFLHQVAPNSLSLLEGVCSGDPDKKPIDAETEGLLKPDFQVLAKTRACTKGCYEEYLNQTIQDVQSICKAWLKFKECMYQCPNGKAVVELIRSIFTKDMDTIQGVCESPNALLPGSIVTSKCSEKVDKKAEFCRKVSKMAKKKYDDPVRLCQWRGFAKICAKMCC